MKRTINKQAILKHFLKEIEVRALKIIEKADDPIQLIRFTLEWIESDLKSNRKPLTKRKKK